MKKAIIYDLDNTLFNPHSLNKDLLHPVFESLKEHGLDTDYDFIELKRDLFSISLNAFIKKYLNEVSKNHFIHSLRKIAYLPKLNTYEDGHIVIQINAINYLVTSGLREFQNLKIDALGIRNWFSEIYIDDPIESEWRDKEEIMRLILHKHNYKPSELLVVGDNPESEIKAGNNLGIDTVQILREGVKASDFANYRIKSLNELEKYIT